LYQKYSDVLKESLTNTILPNHTANVYSGQESGIFLGVLLQSWKKFSLITRFMQKYFCYLDRYHVQHHSLPTLSQVAGNLFTSIVLDVHKQETAIAVMDLFINEKDVQTNNIKLLKGIVTMAKDIGAGFLTEQTNNILLPDLYTQKREQWLQGSVADYVTNSEKFFTSEYQMIVTYLFTVTDESVHDILKEEILEKAQQQLFAKFSETVFATDEENFDIMQRMLSLFELLENGLDPTSEGMQNLILSQLIPSKRIKLSPQGIELHNISSSQNYE
jgi:cullin 1